MVCLLWLMKYFIFIDSFRCGVKSCNLPGETDEVGADTEPGTRTSGNC